MHAQLQVTVTHLDIAPEKVKAETIDALVKQNVLYTFRMVHRLDKNTSGAMIVARSKDAAAWISKAFVEHSRKAKDPSYKGIPGDCIPKCKTDVPRYQSHLRWD